MTAMTATRESAIPSVANVLRMAAHLGTTLDHETSMARVIGATPDGRGLEVIAFVDDGATAGGWNTSASLYVDGERVTSASGWDHHDHESADHYVRSDAFVVTIARLFARAELLDA